MFVINGVEPLDQKSKQNIRDNKLTYIPVEWISQKTTD
jgi:hypothetical protein